MFIISLTTSSLPRCRDENRDRAGKLYLFFTTFERSRASTTILERGLHVTRSRVTRYRKVLIILSLNDAERFLVRGKIIGLSRGSFGRYDLTAENSRQMCLTGNYNEFRRT